MTQTIQIELTDTQFKGLEYAALSPQDWADNVVTNRARIAIDEIIFLLVKHCNENNVQLASGEDAQVTQAFELGVVKTALEVSQEADEELA
jgi:hypothetical protein